MLVLDLKTIINYLLKMPNYYYGKVYVRIKPIKNMMKKKIKIIINIIMISVKTFILHMKILIIL